MADLAAIQASKKTRISLLIDGFDYQNWKSISISRSVVQMAGEFSFTCSNLHAGANQKWNIFGGSPCQVVLEGEPIITGYIDGINPSYDSDSNDITFTGRDKTADLVDCTFDLDTFGNEYFNLTVAQVMQRLCNPFGIEVVLDTPDIASDFAEIIPVHRINPGVFVYEMVAELCQQYGVMPMTLGDGKLHITRTGLFRTFDSLEFGVNIKSASLDLSDKDRFGTYYVYGAQVENAFDKAKALQGKLVDEYIKRHRTLSVPISQGATTKGICDARTAWEQSTREGASRKVTIGLQSWTQSNDVPWPLNAIVPIEDDIIGIKKDQLIASIAMSLDDSGGEIIKLGLVHPDTFKLKKQAKVLEKDKTAFDKFRKNKVANEGT